MNDRGTALIEMLIAGFLAVMVMLPTVHAVVELSDARARASAAAIDEAVWFARHGASREWQGDGRTSMVVDGDIVEVTVSVDVPVVSVGGARVTMTVTERATAAISPYRSSR